MTKYNLSNIMKAANAYAKTMTRSQALRKAWANAKANESIEVFYQTPNQFQPGDRVAIKVGALNGELCWYQFAKIIGEYSKSEAIVGFQVSHGFPPLGFVMKKRERFVVERRIASEALVAA